MQLGLSAWTKYTKPCMLTVWLIWPSLVPMQTHNGTSSLHRRAPRLGCCVLASTYLALMSFYI